MRLVSIFLALFMMTALSSLAVAQPQPLNANVEEYDGENWVDSNDSHDNNDPTSGNGPILG